MYPLLNGQKLVTNVYLDEVGGGKKTCNPLLNGWKLITYVYLDEMNGGKNM